MKKVETVYTKEYYNIQGSEHEIMVVSKYNQDGCVAIYERGDTNRSSVLTSPEEGFIPATKEEFQQQAIKAIRKLQTEANLKTTIIKIK